jgi:preprotein translocase subunit SecD
MYIMGAIDNQGSDDFERRRPSRLCLPEGIGWEAAVDIVVQRLEKFYRARPNLHQTPAGIGVHATALELFSCPRRAKIEIRPADFKEQGFLEKALLPGGKDSIFVTPDALVTNRDIVEAQVKAEPGGFYVDIEFSNDAAPVLRALASIHAGRPIAIFMDGEVISAPIIAGPMYGNRWSVFTGKSESLAKATADALTP